MSFNILVSSTGTFHWTWALEEGFPTFVTLSVSYTILHMSVSEAHPQIPLSKRRLIVLISVLEEPFFC